jgi:GrpB-like predicted nucleotidyltransferase (UPF0157 family)
VSSRPNLSPYDPQAPRRFAAEAKLIAAQLPRARAIEHVGSTAVPDLAGKPTIDIAVGVQSPVLDPADFHRMETLGYAYGGDHGLPQHVFRKGAQVPWEFLVHVVEYDGEMWRNFLRFRDHLRSHPGDARAYAALKEGLLARRGSWYSGRDKETFIAPILTASG